MNRELQLKLNAVRTRARTRMRTDNVTEEVVTENRELQAFKDKTAIIKREATDLCAEPVVQQGYQISGKPAATVYMNLNSMTMARIKKYYPFACNLKDPLYARIYARVQKICAECIKLKYEMRQQRIPFEHILEINRRVDDFFKIELPATQAELQQITAEVTNGNG